MNELIISSEAVINSMKSIGMSELAIKKVADAFEFQELFKEEFQDWLRRTKK